jgi:hypothetical protein
VLQHRFLGVNRRIEYFLAELVREAGPPEDGRKRIWCGFEEALERLDFRDMRKLLRDAWRELPRRERREGRERREKLALSEAKGREALEKNEGRERRKGKDRREARKE